jgi:AAA15 family ATPase/GTPase
MVSVLSWFSQRLVIVPADSYYKDLVELIARNPEFAEFAGNFLQGISTGVNSLRVETSEMDENALAAIPTRMREVISRLPVGETTSFGANDDSGSQIIIEKGTGTKILFRTVKSEHLTATGEAVRFPFAEESDGTRRITQLLPALHSVGRGRNIFVIDEIDRSLHPLLAKGFVREFLNACVNKGAQLIFTTHDTTFLDLDLLRRDEIWFANKQMPVGETELYSLSDYKVRTDLKIDKAYLQGRFNAVPPIEVELPDWVNKIMAELRPRQAATVHTEEVNR